MSVAHHYPSQIAARQVHFVRRSTSSRISLRMLEILALVAAGIAALAVMYPGELSAQSATTAVATSAKIEKAKVDSPALETTEAAETRKPVRVIEIWKTPVPRSDAGVQN